MLVTKRLVLFVAVCSLIACDQSPEVITADEWRLAGEENDRLYQEALLQQTSSMGLSPICLGNSGTADYSQLAAVLDEARGAINPDEYSIALGKFLCVHIFSIGTPYIGVRSSYALADWHRLGQAFHPALDSLHKFRDQAAVAVRGNAPYYWEAFRDHNSISDVLEEAEVNVELFEWLHANDIAAAKSVYNMVDTDLVKYGRFELWLSYIPDPDIHFRNIIRERDAKLAGLDSSVQSQYLKTAFNRYFENDTLTLLVALEATGQLPFAMQLAEEALKIHDDDAFRLNIRLALDGEYSHWL